VRNRRVKAVAALAAILCLSSAVAAATVVQKGAVRVTILAQIAPYRLPRTGTAPISAFLSGHVEPTHGGIPPQLKRMDIKINRHGLLQWRGLPTCRVSQIRTASTEKALQLCAPALVGSGRFWAHIVLPDQSPYPTHGRLLIFNGRKGSTPQILAHIFTSNPFPSSFVIAFSIRHLSSGTWGTELSAALPQALGNWGYVDRIKLNLKRKYRYRGRALSYFNAGCPALRGAALASFPLARAAFYFEQQKVLQANVTKACGVKE
jgi:hypothetical protein